MAQSEVVVQDRLEDVSKLKENISQKSASDQGKAQEVMLPPIIVNGSSAGAKAASSQAAGVKVAGQVVSINQENNFVIIDLGQSAGINIGDRLSVYRGDTYVGEVEIIQVRTDISAADIKKQSMPFQAGDTVK
ncbi:MAG: hypothetical protein NT079_02645 [Candidatus Omnitrophica bacterium]|nr:hypothetical protein [Candidatus Omnitrophota bacterium]